MKKLRIGQVVRVTVDWTAAENTTPNHSKAQKDDLLDIVSVSPLIGKCWTGLVRLTRKEVRALTAKESGRA